MKYHVQVIKFWKEDSSFKGLINLGSHTHESVVALLKKDFNIDISESYKALASSDGSFVSFSARDCEAYGDANLDIIVTTIQP
jgi:hypothetical protein